MSDDKLIEALRYGVPTEGTNTDGLDLYDIDAAETIMARAADALAAKDAALSEMRVELGRLRLALKPFAAYASLSSFDRLPADMPLTPGSGMAARQVTVGDFRAAARALSSHADGDAK